MSLINEALNKSQKDAGTVQSHVLSGTGANSTQTLAYKGRKGVNKRKTSSLSISILGAILACTIVFYYVCNFTNLIPQFSSVKKAEARLKDGMDFASYAKASKETTPALPESIQDTITLPQGQGEVLVEPVSSSVTDVMQLPEVQTVKSSASILSLRAEGEAIPSIEIASETTSPRNDPSREVKTQITEGEVEQRAQISPEQPQNNDEWYAAYHFGMGVFHQKNKEIEKAVEEYDKVIKFDPDNAEVHINLGVIYKDKGDLDKAVEEYEKALAIDPHLEVGYNNLGVAYFLKGNYTESIRHYQKAVEINPKNLESYVNLGITYGMQKRSDEAIRAFQTAISINPQHAETQYNLAIIYDENGEIEKALLYYSRFLEFYRATQSELIDRVKRRIDVLSSKLKAKNLE